MNMSSSNPNDYLTSSNSSSNAFHVGHNTSNSYRGGGGRGDGNHWRGGRYGGGSNYYRGGRRSSNRNDNYSDRYHGDTSRYGARRLEQYGNRPMRGRGGGGGGPMVPRNRVSQETSSSSSSSSNPMILQLSAMMAKLGSVEYTDVVAPQEDDKLIIRERPDVGKQARDLAAVLCAPTNVNLFFQTTNDSSSPPAAIALLVQCASTLPLQTNGYVALTVAMEQTIPGSILSPCCDYATRQLVADLCQIIPATIVLPQTSSDLEHSPTNKTIMFNFINQLATHRSKLVHGIMRVKLLLRYLAVLSKIGLVQLLPNDTFTTDDSISTFTTTTPNMMGLLQYLVQLAQIFIQQLTTTTTNRLPHETTSAYSHLCKLLCYWVLSTLPYIVGHPSEEMEQVKDLCSRLFQQVQTIWTTNKEFLTSAYKPGRGIYAIYSSREEYDVFDAEDEEQEDEEEEEQEEAESCSDTLEELIRVISRLEKCNWDTSASTIMKEGEEEEEEDENSSPTILSCGAPNFAIFSDAPWEGLLPNTSSSSSIADDDMETTTNIVPIPLTVLSNLTLPSFLEEDKTNNQEEEDVDEDATFFTVGTTMEDKKKKAKTKSGNNNHISYAKQCILLASLPPFCPLICGRFPILDDSDDSDILQKLFRQTTPSDRFFFAECIREVMFAHVPTVSPSGTEYTPVKHVASYVLGVPYLFSGIAGAESYMIMETLLGSIVQSSANTFYKSPFFVGKVLVELCKLQQTFPAALVHGIGLVVGSEFSTLLPMPRRCFSKWFAFHWINTDFQWPYWSHWDKYASSSNSNKTQFLRDVFEEASNIFSQNFIIEKCLPENSPHAALLQLPPSPNLDDITTPIKRTIAEMREKIIGKELASELSEWLSTVVLDDDEEGLTFWRTKVAIQAIIGGILFRDATSSATDGNVSDEVSEVIEILSRYSSVLSSAMEKDNQAYGTNDDGDTSERILLEESYSICSSSSTSSLLVAVVFRLLTGGLHLVSLLSLMEFISLRMKGSDGKDDSMQQSGSEDTECITNIWDIAIQCLGNKVEIGIKSAITQHLTDTSNQMLIVDDSDGAEEKRTKDNDGCCEEAIATVSNTSIEIEEAVSYTTKRVLSIASQTEGDHAAGSKISPRMSRLLDGLRAYILFAQARILDLSYVRLSLLNEPGSINSCKITGKILIENGQNKATTAEGAEARVLLDFFKILRGGAGIPIV